MVKSRFFLISISLLFRIVSNLNHIWKTLFMLCKVNVIIFRQFLALSIEAYNMVNPFHAGNAFMRVSTYIHHSWETHVCVYDFHLFFLESNGQERSAKLLDLALASSSILEETKKITINHAPYAK